MAGDFSLNWQNASAAEPDRRLSVAPMLDWTDRHYRRLVRCFSREVLLYTEMVTTGALLNGNRDRFLEFSTEEHPLALQLGGSDPAHLELCARIAEDYGYDEINLNVGCPSPRVQRGSFGACLMLEPALVAECYRAMRDAVRLPVTLKCRIGVDDHDSYEHLHQFVSITADAGCRSYAVHARKAWLSGLSPKENREVPPLQYATVHRLKQDFPELEIVINGGIQTLAQVNQQLQSVDGVMIGREAYQNPAILGAADQLVFGNDSGIVTPMQALDEYTAYVSEQLARGVRLHNMTRHLLGLFHGQPGARSWRRHLSEHAPRSNSMEILLQARSFMEQAIR